MHNFKRGVLIILMWIEVNINQPSELSKDDCLIKFVEPTFRKYKNGIKSWHFLWEGKPWSSTLRLRFLGNKSSINEICEFLEEILKGIPHCYGAHGEEGKEYEGEENDWGIKGWERGKMFLEFGAEFALELIQNKDNLGKNNNYKKDAFFFADRYTYLFLNQISSLVNEADFNLLEGVFRYACQHGKILPSEKVKDLTERIKQDILNPQLSS